MSEQLPTENLTSSAPKPTEKHYISIEDFAKVDLRVATVLEADHVEGADKLLRLSVKIGAETRQIFAGIKAAYEPSQLIGRQIIVVANLAPRKMRFGLSEGMMIVASDADKSGLFIVSPDAGATDGMSVK